MQSQEKVQYMTNEESYTQRRLLFKNIWETAIDIDEKDDIMNKPKVIKTLRLDEVDKCVIGKTKKQRVRNLRHVCKRILDFCDRQDADDVFYEQLASDGVRESVKAIHKKLGLHHSKNKFHRDKLNIKKAMSYVTQKNTKDLKLKTISEQKGAAKSKPLKHSSHSPEKRTLQNSKAKMSKRTQSPTKKERELSPARAGKGSTEAPLNQPSVICRKSIKKKYTRRKKASDIAVHEIADMIKGKSSAGPRASPKLRVQNQAKPLPKVTKIMIS